MTASFGQAGSPELQRDWGRRETVRRSSRSSSPTVIQVENYHRAFPDMHCELYQLYVSGNIVVVQLALPGTHRGPLHLPTGTLAPTGKRMDAPCCDVFELASGKIKRFDCYPSGTVIMTQLGVLGNLSGALEH